jgi:hypothetical protein
MKPFFDYQREVGMAAWLFMLYWQNHSPETDSEWTVVGNGGTIRDSDTAKVLKVSVRTAIRWRRRLREAGLIRAEACRSGGFQIWLLNLNRSQEIEPRGREAWPEMQTELVQ